MSGRLKGEAKKNLYTFFAIYFCVFSQDDSKEQKRTTHHIKVISIWRFLCHNHPCLFLVYFNVFWSFSYRANILSWDFAIWNVNDVAVRSSARLPAMWPDIWQRHSRLVLALLRSSWAKKIHIFKFQFGHSLRSKRSCAFLAKGKPRNVSSLSRAKNGESAKNEARGKGKGGKGTLASNHCESQIRPLGIARFSDFDENDNCQNTQSKFGGRNTGGSKQTIVPCKSCVKRTTRECEGFSQVEDTDLQIALKIHGAAICKM